MNIFVCIKQVPATNKVKVDEKTGVLQRSGIASKMNPYDLYALETVLRLKEPFTLMNLIGACLIIGAAMMSEIRRG